MTPVIIFQVGVQPIEMQFALFKIPPLDFSPLWQVVGIFLVGSQIYHPKFVMEFKHNLYKIQFLVIVGLLILVHFEHGVSS